MTAIAAPTEYRSLFLSDTHLGTRGCQVGQLLNFLANHDAETIYLVGDIIDKWRLDVRWYWPDDHNSVLRLLQQKAKRGTRLVYVPGNHDEFAREFNGTKNDNIEFADRIVHETADGRRFLVVHGDCFDVVLQTKARWLAFLGDQAYVAALAINTFVNRIGRSFGMPFWSFSNWAKMRVKAAVNFIGHYEEALVSAAREHDVDGVICGHIHHAVIHEDFGLTYVNCGDWVESCTAAVEHADGRIEIVNWARFREPEAFLPGIEDEGEGEGAIA